MEDITFGNSLSKRKLTVGPRSPVRFLCNMGHMDLQESLDAEKRKVELAHEYGIDIIADNSITEKSRELREWIKHNFPMMMNTVPAYGHNPRACGDWFRYDRCASVHYAEAVR